MEGLGEVWLPCKLLQVLYKALICGKQESSNATFLEFTVIKCDILVVSSISLGWVSCGTRASFKKQQSVAKLRRYCMQLVHT